MRTARQTASSTRASPRSSTCSARLPTEGPLATGLRATPDTIADLLVEDLRTDGRAIRERVPEALESLASRSVLQKIEGAYILQTPAGAEWDCGVQGTRGRPFDGLAVAG